MSNTNEFLNEVLSLISLKEELEEADLNYDSPDFAGGEDENPLNSDEFRLIRQKSFREKICPSLKSVSGDKAALATIVVQIFGNVSHVLTIGGMTVNWTPGLVANVVLALSKVAIDNYCMEEIPK
jgi:hypothetical protein